MSIGHFEIMSEKERRHRSKSKETRDEKENSKKKPGKESSEKKSKSSSKERKPKEKEKILLPSKLEKPEKSRSSHEKSQKKSENSSTEPKPREKSKEKKSAHKQKEDEEKRTDQPAVKKHTKDKKRQSDNEITANGPIKVIEMPKDLVPASPRRSDSGSAKSMKSPKFSTEPANVPNGDIPYGEDEYQYEEDFEDYEEDFEEDDEENEEIAKISARPDTSKSIPVEDENRLESKQKPIKAQIAESVASPESRTDTQIGTRPRTVQSRIDFSRASVTEMKIGAMSTNRQRHYELLKLIELDSTTMDVFDMGPVKDYEFYMENFGKSNRTQVQVQTKDDNVERDLQTDEVDTESKWSQHPPTDLFGCGSEITTKSYNDSGALKFDSEILNSNSFRQFIERTSTILLDLLSQPSEISADRFQSKSQLEFSERFATIKILELVGKSARVVSGAFSHPKFGHVIAGISSEQEISFTDSNSLLIAWEIASPQVPKYVLSCDSTPNCCCFSPEKPGAAFAGLDDGSVIAYDLDEFDRDFKRIQISETIAFSIRTPSYNTTYMSNSKDGSHVAPIKGICAIRSTRVVFSAQEQALYQLVSLDEQGQIFIWSVLYTATKEPSELDLGLKPGARLKLVKSTFIKPADSGLRNLSRSDEWKTFCLANRQNELGHFYLGTDTGYILHVNRPDGTGGIRTYQPELEVLADVTSMQFSPFNDSILLTGASDGCVRLYRLNYTKPVHVMQLETAKVVVAVRWSNQSPYQFFSLYADGTLAKWDLKQSHVGPAAIHKTKSTILLTAISHDDDSASLDFMAFTNETGDIEIHWLKSSGQYSKLEGSKKLLKELQN